MSLHNLTPSPFEELTMYAETEKDSGDGAWTDSACDEGDRAQQWNMSFFEFGLCFMLRSNDDNGLS